eukprot:CAMPEP_0168192206 /NCGR_PEP_ID=MMETSP0139_2-20121125/17922_1 /TAXON_ID=44445 /ORGANISM="Pseudo-nitzschia australis, Strain 10249 10 AB" /LENGTH=169 /DNA_ID=CAMNT_0008115425 /DNA_START=105 /DNA_END=614 /DNA_ORIENTATION=+
MVPAIYFVGLAVMVVLVEKGIAFQPIISMSKPGHRRGGDLQSNRYVNHYLIGTNCDIILFASPSEREELKNMIDGDESNFNDEINEDKLEEIISEQPLEFDFRVLQQMLGINIFTLLLAALIVFFLSMNAILGPGWLGSKIGIPGTGNIQEMSPMLPGSIDLNRPEYRL